MKNIVELNTYFITQGPAEISHGPAEITHGPTEIAQRPAEITHGPAEISHSYYVSLGFAYMNKHALCINIRTTNSTKLSLIRR